MVKTIILAGGLGKRMKSELPKVLHLVNGKPMIYLVIKTALQVSNEIFIVVGKYKDEIRTVLKNTDLPMKKIIFIDQPEEIIGCFKKTIRVKGTGDAIACCLPYLKDEPMTDILILSGDVPFIKVETLKKLLEKKNTILIHQTKIPGYGRILFSEDSRILKIIEEKDCTKEQKKIEYVNAGIYNVTIETLMQTIPEIKNKNKAKEYYFTDFIEIANNKKINIYGYELDPFNQYNEIININTPEDLDRANNI